jgi:hypothetical protein
MTRSGKYGPLFDWFAALPATTNEVRLTFGKIEEVIGGLLPRSAHEYDAWWTDASAGTTHVHALAWLETEVAHRGSSDGVPQWDILP